MHKGKIVHVTSSHPYNDNRIFLKECRSLSKSGYDIHLIYGDYTHTIYHEGVSIHGYDKFNDGKFKIVTIYFITVIRYLLSFRANVYHFHDIELLPISILIRLLGKKVIFDIHEDNYTSILRSSYIPKFLRLPIATIVRIMEHLASGLMIFILAERYYQNIFIEGELVLNYPEINEEIRRKEINHKNKDRKLIYTGNITESRGGIIYANVSKRLPDVHFFLIGKCDKELSKKILSISTRDNLSIEGIGTYVSHQYIDQQYLETGWIAGLAIFPGSEHYYEKELTKFFEYMLAGIPVVYSKFPVWEKLLGDNGVGIGVDPNDTDQIVESIKWLKDNPQKRNEMGRKARKLVIEKYNWKSQEANLLKIYDNLI